jgi:hypothetical protein
MLTTISLKEVSNTPYCLREIIGIGKKNNPEMIGSRTIKTRALYDQHAFCR